MSQWIKKKHSINSTQKIDKATENIFSVLKNAMKVGVKRPDKSTSRLAPLWTPVWKNARQNYKAAVMISEETRKTIIFRFAVASAKRRYWKRRVEAMKPSFQAFWLVCLLSSGQENPLPLLQNEGWFVMDQAERAEILENSLLARHDTCDYLPS